MLYSLQFAISPIFPSAVFFSMQRVLPIAILARMSFTEYSLYVIQLPKYLKLACFLLVFTVSFCNNFMYFAFAFMRSTRSCFLHINFSLCMLFLTVFSISINSQSFLRACNCCLIFCVLSCRLCPPHLLYFLSHLLTFVTDFSCHSLIPGNIQSVSIK